MAALSLILASESKAAKLLDMKPSDFRALVDAGVLPKPAEIGGFKRWDVEQLRAIASGDLASGPAVIEW
ncbi:MAG: hypothetical protein GYB53_10195 [Rhodobacteraceae bacterium]|uniref:hypothetical protein n=1 Tax=Oceanicola sp. S124 TaxID=1042378 RepID=UPI000255821B|nr:hypothetical protein [Oceanicola sp. S124]MBR9763873.1 hypothetical protein [Paracoccaceae bacterium]MBR9820753.1 hypothetical protein [Paracoccaceae bacterium]